MNRKQRRAAGADAARKAAMAARLVYDIEPRGKVVLVTDVRAIEVIERGFLHVLRSGLQPHLMRISEEVAHTFPRYGGDPPMGGWAYYLAVGFDRLGRGTYLLRPVKVEGAQNAMAARQLVEARMFRDLQAQLEDTSPILASFFPLPL